MRSRLNSNGEGAASEPPFSLKGIFRIVILSEGSRSPLLCHLELTRNDVQSRRSGNPDQTYWTLYNVKPPTKITAPKTNAARLLDQLGIHYELRAYEVDPEDLAAETVAAKIGLPAEQVFKTLVAHPSGSKGPNGALMAVIPGDQELDLKALASAAGEKKIELVPVKELQALTGYIRGGVAALAAKRDFPVFVDETIELFDVISISAGMRGLQILLAPADYLRATKGTIAALGQPKKQ